MFHKAATNQAATISNAIANLHIGIQQNAGGFEAATSKDAQIKLYAALATIEGPDHDVGYSVSTRTQSDVDHIRMNKRRDIVCRFKLFAPAFTESHSRRAKTPHAGLEFVLIERQVDPGTQH